jgi:hypothetical protein
MRCSEFLHGYSDFRDETIDDPLVRRLFIAHVSLCGRCARYQEVVDLGVSLLRSADQIEVSPRFHTRLARRLAAAVLHPEPVFAVPVRLLGSLVIAATIAVVVIEGVTRDSRKVEPLPAPARPMPMVQSHARPPFVFAGDLTAPGVFSKSTWSTGGYSQRTSRALVTLTSLADPSRRHTLTSQSQPR